MRTTDQFCDKATERMIRRVRIGYWSALLVIALMAMGTFLLVDSAISMGCLPFAVRTGPETGA